MNYLCIINDSFTIDHMEIRHAVHQLKPIERFECDWWWSCRDLRLVGPVSAGLEIIITTCCWLRGSAVCSLNGGIQLKWIRTQKVYRSGILRPSHHQFPHITHRQYFNQIKLLTIRSCKLKAFSLLAILFHYLTYLDRYSYLERYLSKWKIKRFWRNILYFVHFSVLHCIAFSYVLC